MGWLRPYLLGGIGFQYSQLRVSLDGAEDSETKYNFAGRLAGGLDIMFHEHLGFHIEGFAILPAGGPDFSVVGAGQLADRSLRSVGFNTGFRYVF